MYEHDRKFKIVVPENYTGRLDAFLYEFLPRDFSLSRSKIKAHIQNGSLMRENTLIFEPSKKVKPNEVFLFTIPKLKSSKVVPQDIPLEIIYEDKYILVINKPSGLVVHPGSGVSEGTLINALLFICGSSIANVGSSKRPGIVHRLDKLTSGLLVVAKTEKAYQGLIPQFANHSITRQYHALVWGSIERSFDKLKASFVDVEKNADHFKFSSQIGRHPFDRKKMSVLERGGKSAISKFREIDSFNHDGKLTTSLVKCELETGRTHQIRVHLSHLGNPIIGDPVYGKKFKRSVFHSDESTFLTGFERQALHATSLGFNHPISEEYVEFKVKPPEDFSNLLRYLSKSTKPTKNIDCNTNSNYAFLLE